MPKYNSGQWSIKYKKCVKCGTKKRKHRQNGYCVRCWAKKRYNDNKDKCKAYQKKYRDNKK